MTPEEEQASVRQAFLEAAEACNRHWQSVAERLISYRSETTVTYDEGIRETKTVIVTRDYEVEP